MFFTAGFSPSPEQRLKAIRFTKEACLELLGGRAVVEPGQLPDDAKVESMYWSDINGELIVRIGSDGFDPVPEGHDFPEIMLAMSEAKPRVKFREFF